MSRSTLIRFVILMLLSLIGVVVRAVGAAPLVSAPIAQSAIQPTWQPPQLLPRAIGELTSLSCPSTGLCLGAGVPSSTGTDLPSFVISTHPSSGAAWHFDEHSDRGDWQIFECSSTALCVGSYSRGLRTDLYASTHPDRGRYSFTKVAANINAASISCATTRFCAVVSGSAGEEASVWVSTNPARPGSWHRRAALPRTLTTVRGDEIMCPSSEGCIVFATQGSTNDVAILEHPASPQSSWVRADADPEADSMAVIGGSCHDGECEGEQFTGGSCVAPGSCILTTGYGAIVASTSVAGGSSTWTRTVIYGDGHEPRGAYGLSDPVCFSSSLCYVLGSRGDLLVSTGPFSSNPATWTTIHIPGATDRSSLTCPTPQTCLVIDPARTGNRTALVVGHLAPEQLAGITVSSGGDIGSRTHTSRIIASGSLIEELDGTRWSARRAPAGAASTTAVVSSSGLSSLPHTILEDIHSVLHPFAQDSLTGRPGKADSTCHLRGMPGLRVPPYPACQHVEATLTSAFLVASGGGFHTDCNDPYAVTYHFYEVHTYGQGFNTCGPGPQGILRSPIRTTPGQLLPALEHLGKLIEAAAGVSTDQAIMRVAATQQVVTASYECPQFGGVKDIQVGRDGRTTTAECSAVTASTKPPYCDYPNNYYPGLCGVPKQKATDSCAVGASEDNEPVFSHLRVRFGPGPKRYTLSFMEESTLGCGLYAGSRKVSYVEELRNGPTGAFAPTGPAVTAIANGRYAVNRPLPQEPDCSISLAGSAVRVTVTVGWIPKPGWGKTPDTQSFGNTSIPLVWAYASKAQVVC